MQNKKFLKFFCCSRLALRNHSGATQKTNFIADVSLVRNNQLLQSTAISSDGKSPSTSDSKKQKNDHTHCCSRITSKKKSKQGSDKIYCYDRLRHTDNVKVRTKIKENGSYENNFSELALQQNTFELNTKKD